MPKPLLHVRKLGYWLNPFATLTDAQWLEIGYLHPLLEDALTSGRDLQLLGMKGAGKTTALRLMANRLVQKGHTAAYEYIPEGQRVFNTNTAAVEVFILDEAQRLNLWQKRRLRKSGREMRLLVSSHQDVGRWLKRPLTIDVEQLHTFDHWQTMIERRLAYFALPEVDRVTFSEAAVRSVYKRFAPDFRTAEFFLYDLWERLDDVVEVDGARVEAMQKLEGKGQN